MKCDYDFLIVGSGLFGAVFAHEAKKAGKTCLIIDKRNHSGGNIYCNNLEDINVHQYGAHIFHTNDEFIWNYVQQFVTFNRYTNSPLANYNDKLYNLPFNMNTFYQLWGCKTPDEAKAIIDKQIASLQIDVPKNLEEQALKLVGTDIYHKLIKGYTEKQWGRKATELPSFIIKRLPIRFTFDNNYFNDKYQGVPIGGYNKLINGLTNGIEIRLNADYFKNRNYYNSIAKTVVFTGKIDEYFNYCFGNLEYRSLLFENSLLHISNFQGNAVVNYTSFDVPYTRIIEHKHFEFGTQPNTIITKEFSVVGNLHNEPYYPINDEKNNLLYNRYKQMANKEKNVIFGGRLAEYKYYDMHQVVASSLHKVKVALNSIDSE